MIYSRKLNDEELATVEAAKRDDGIIDERKLAKLAPVGSYAKLEAVMHDHNRELRKARKAEKSPRKPRREKRQPWVCPDCGGVGTCSVTVCDNAYAKPWSNYQDGIDDWPEEDLARLGL